MACSACGAACPPGARHCPGCGLRLGGVATAAAPAVAAAGNGQPLAGGALLNRRYLVERVLGSGAFGRVYLASDTQDPNGTLVAVKELLDTQFTTDHDKREAIAWFKREVSTLLALDHPSIPDIYGYWTGSTAAGPFYLAIEYIPGKTLEETAIDAGGCIGWRDVAAWGIVLCDVLAYLHSRVPPFIFRDMKTPNVMLDDRTRRPVLIDFGIARQLVPSGGTAIGTWGYVPYEQVLGRAEPRSDLYALGAMVYALLTGRQPDAEYTRLMRAGLDTETAMKSLFPLLDPLAHGIPAPLCDAVARATAFAASDRFADAGAMAAALGLALGTIPPDLTPFLGTVTPGSGIVSSPNVPLAITGPAPARVGAGASPSSDTIVVSKLGRGHCTTIGEALANATDGMRIEVQAGHYREELVVDRSVEIVGVDRPETIVIEAIEGPCLRVQAPAALIRGLTLAGRAGTQDKEFYALEITAGQSVIDECHITSDSLACVAVRGVGAAPVLRRCRVTDGAHAGVLFSEGAQGTIEHSDIAGSAMAGIEIRQGANPVVRRCAIHDGGDAGVFVLAAGQGVVEDCEIYGNALMGVAIKEGSTPTIRRTKIHSGRHTGVMVYQGGRGEIQNCDIYGNANAGIGIIQGADPLVWHCIIKKGGGPGVAVDDDGRGSIDGCEIFGNAGHGIEIKDVAAPTIRQCRVTGNGGAGVFVQDKGAGTVEGCDLTGNAAGPWNRPFFCKIRRAANLE